MPVTKNGPVVDDRPPMYGAPWLWQTVGPSRILVTCATPFAGFPELEDGVVLTLWSQVNEPPEPYAQWRGFTGFNDLFITLLMWNDPIFGNLWQGGLITMLSLGLWTAPVIGDRWPKPILELSSIATGDANLVVRPLSEWVVVSEMFPTATLSDIPS